MLYELECFTKLNVLQIWHIYDPQQAKGTTWLVNEINYRSWKYKTTWEANTHYKYTDPAQMPEAFMEFLHNRFIAIGKRVGDYFASEDSRASWTSCRHPQTYQASEHMCLTMSPNKTSGGNRIRTGMIKAKPIGESLGMEHALSAYLRQPCDDVWNPDQGSSKDKERCTCSCTKKLRKQRVMQHGGAAV